MTSLYIVAMWIVTIVITVALQVFSVNIIKEKGTKVTRKLWWMLLIVWFILVQLIRMFVDPVYDYSQAKFEVVDSLELEGKKVIINGKETDIYIIYGNYSMPCNMLIKCKKKKNTLIPGVYSGDKDINKLVVTKSTYSELNGIIPSFLDNDEIFKETGLALDEVKNLGINRMIVTNNGSGEITSDGVGNIYYGTIYNTNETVSEVYEQRIYNLEKKVEELENQVKDLDKSKDNDDNKPKVNVIISVVSMLVVIWFMGLITYVIIIRTSTKNKIDLIDSSSAAKIREGVMLEGRDTK